MTVQNPETEDKSETKIENTEVTEDKALDTARQIAKGDITFEDVKDEALLDEIHQRFAVEEEEIPEEGEKSPEEGTSESETKTGEESKTVVEPVDDGNQEFLQKRKADLDELNQIQQKIDAKQKRLGEMDDLSVAPKKKTHEDILSEESMEDTQARLDKIEKRQTEYFTGKSEDLKKDTNSLKTEKLHLEIKNFQLENTGLKTSKPVNVINAQYKQFVEKIGGFDNVDKFLKDPKYREQKEAEGHSFPLSDADYKNFDTLSKVNAFKNSRKYPTLQSAFHDYQRENGIVLDNVKNAAIKAAQDTLENVGSNAGATTLSPDIGNGGTEAGQSEMSDASMETWLIAHPNPTTKAEVQKAEEIHQILMKRGG